MHFYILFVVVVVVVLVVLIQYISECKRMEPFHQRQLCQKCICPFVKRFYSKMKEFVSLKANSFLLTETLFRRASVHKIANRKS